VQRKKPLHLFSGRKDFMLSNEAFAQWCQRLALSEEAHTIITRIRASPPSRRVQGRAGNVSGQYPSRKMGFGIQFESRRNEVAAITLMEHDPTVLEYYDQPERIKLSYQGPQKRVSVGHTPDFFVLREDGAGCIGLLKEWLLKALTETLERSAKTISPEILAHHAPSLAHREQMMREIEEGEKGFTYDEAAEDELRKRMGLPRRRKTQEERATPAETNEEQKTTKKRASSVGHRRPAHDPVKGGTETDGQACEPAV